MFVQQNKSLPYPTIILTGLLYGLSFSPVFLPFSLGFLAWFCWLPLLIKLRQLVDQPKLYFASVYLSFLLGNLLAMWWLLSTISITAYLFAIAFVFALTYSLVFLPFYLLHRYLGWQRSSFLLPFLWTGWEWLLTLQDYHTAVTFFGYTQVDYPYLIQYCELTGVWGISFWLLLINVVLANIIIELKPISQAKIVRSIGKISLIFAIPISYGYFSTQSWEHKLTQLPTVNIALLQPNFSKEEKRTQGLKLVEKMVIDSTAVIQAQRPDLMVWPESAVLGNALSMGQLRDYLFTVVGRWNTSLLFGFLEPVEDDEWHWDKPLLFGLLTPPKNSQFHNSALLITPQLARYAAKKKSEEIPLKIYRKQHLMPFSEKVPFADIFPALQKLAISMEGGQQLNAHKGEDKGYIYSFLDTKGNIRRTGIRICYEVMYPSTTAKMLQNGAQMLVILSNDASFGRTPESSRMKAYTSLLAITTRRSIARDASTGLTFFTDPLGRIYGQVPWWETKISLNALKLNSELSFYSRYPDLFPKLCLVFIILTYGWWKFKKIYSNHFLALKNS